VREFVTALAFAVCLYAGDQELLTIPGPPGRPGGTLSFAQRTEPKTLNPVIAADSASKEVIQRLQADLIHINRETQLTEPALAKSWEVSPDGLRYTLALRRGLRFSDGSPFNADDVVFSFRLYEDENIGAPQRDLLILQGKPIAVRKADDYTVVFELSAPYAAAERLFDGFAILPRHLLEGASREHKIANAWTLQTAPAAMAGLGPFRVKEYVPGQHIVLARNPYYWKTDSAGTRLPYLDEAVFEFAGSENAQAMRFLSGESDVLSRAGARDFASLERERNRRGYTLKDLGAGMEQSFLFFNLNPGREGCWQDVEFRRAVSLAIDRDAMVRLVYLGHASPLASPVPLGNRRWVDATLPSPQHSPSKAREILTAARFSWASDGSLRDPIGKPVEFSIAASAGNSERLRMAAMIQDDLKQLGITVHVVPLELRSLLDRVQRTRDYEACLLSFAGADADPNPDMGIWLSNGANHLWNPEQKSPATPWEAEIDDLMRRQMITRGYAGRKRLFDRVQQLAMGNLPLIPLVTPNILVGAKAGLGNFRPAVLDHYTLWNIDELYWRAPAVGGGR
jgi:peptide/nickel transport system substrate-binding protein